ncbi:lectin-like domain-containing protein [Portibacter marinus]|uniref:lectin-like domain-containing protein n=1 Tax=Portibacter marinus TaxID=2898660 RepID=UPI001F3E97B7|nr:OmpA family protein [Portibacter marinus]
MKYFATLLIISLSLQSIDAQEVKFNIRDFVLTGTAASAGGEGVVLTENQFWQGGAMWYKDDIDLTKPFNMEMEIYFGCSDAGADGIVFILHPELSTGFRGEGMGFGGLYPSFGVEMDTYENFHLSDPYFDHVALMAHGSLRHPFGLTDPVALDPNRKNIEDCDYHKVSVDWTPSSNIFRFYFDRKLRVEEKVDLVGDLFDGNPFVYWGFGSATGGKRNKHMVKLEKLEFTENVTLKFKDKEALLKGDAYTLRKLEFASGSTRLPESAKPELDKLIQFFKQFPGHSIILDGFTDSSGSESSNLRLSKLRVESIAEYLKSKGIPESKLFYYGNGEANPIDTNETEEGRMNNRRVEVRMRIIKV